MSRWVIYACSESGHRVVNLVPYYSMERAFLDAAEMQLSFPGTVFTVVEAGDKRGEK